MCSRAFIRHACGDDEMFVPSPTFLLMNSYDEVTTGPSITHFDLYRLMAGADMERLELETAQEKTLCLIEWPERLLSTPDHATHVHISTLSAVCDQ